MASKKKATKRTRRPKQPQTHRGHQATHTVQELRDHGHAVLIFSQSDKRALGASLGASMGSVLGLLIAENPSGFYHACNSLGDYIKAAAQQNPEMFSKLGINFGAPSAGSAGPAIPNETILFDVWSSKEAPAPLGGGDGVWFERRDVAIWRTSSDGTRHAFALAFDGATPSACGQASDTATSPLFEIKGVCGSCQSILTDHGYKPPRMGAPPPPGPQPVDADFTPGPKRRKRTRKAKTPATASE